MHYFLGTMFPVMVSVNAALSLEPASVDLMLKVPLAFKVPLAPEYLPVPPVMTALPTTVTPVGAASPSAQALALGSTFTVMVFPPPPNVPVPMKASH